MPKGHYLVETLHECSAQHAVAESPYQRWKVAPLYVYGGSHQEVVAGKICRQACHPDCEKLVVVEPQHFHPQQRKHGSECHSSKHPPVELRLGERAISHRIFVEYLLEHVFGGKEYLYHGYQDEDGCEIAIGPHLGLIIGMT